jgi:peptide/nickel transport system substrate-binding protein
VWEPSSDGLQYHFKLKEGVLFHGGYGEVTAEDVKFSFERIAGFTGETLAYAPDWVALERVKVDGKYEGTIVLKDPYAPLMATTIPWNSGSIASKRAMEELGKEHLTHPIGTGPYEFANWEPKQKVTLRRFEEWHGDPAPDWDEIEILPVADFAAAEIALESGELDFAQISVTAADRFDGNDAFTLYAVPTTSQDWVGMNVLHPKLTNIDVRQAIRYAIDVPAILEAAYEGKSGRATAIVPPTMPIGHWDDAPVYERDVDKAKGFMTSAGVDSLDLDFHSWATYISSDTAKTIGEIVQANLAEIGINVNVIIVSDYSSLGKPLRNQQLFFASYTITPPDPVWCTQWFRCDGFDAYNWMYQCIPEFDRLDIAATKELDTQKRQEMYVEEQRLMDEAVHSVWISWPTIFFASKQDIKAAPRASGDFVLPGFEKV